MIFFMVLPTFLSLYWFVAVHKAQRKHLRYGRGLGTDYFVTDLFTRAHAADDTGAAQAGKVLRKPALRQAETLLDGADAAPVRSETPHDAQPLGMCQCAQHLRAGFNTLDIDDMRSLPGLYILPYYHIIIIEYYKPPPHKFCKKLPDIFLQQVVFCGMVTCRRARVIQGGTL